jgi:hypothetical protein
MPWNPQPIQPGVPVDTDHEGRLPLLNGRQDARVSTASPVRPLLEESSGLAAAWLAARIEDNPVVLGLGEGMPAFEHTLLHERPDQFAVILFHPATGIRHIIEVQLGEADTAQVSRALRHWEDESARLPGIEHRAAIAAERIPASVAAAAHARRGCPLDAVELHAQRAGELVTVRGEPLAVHDTGTVPTVP